jgi:hypothetical protein
MEQRKGNGLPKTSATNSQGHPPFHAPYMQNNNTFATDYKKEKKRISKNPNRHAAEED